MISRILFRHTPRTVQEKLISFYVWALILCWGHFSASFVGRYLKNHKATISRHMKKDLSLFTLQQTMLKKVTEKAGKRAWLIIDSLPSKANGAKNSVTYRNSGPLMDTLLVTVLSLPCLSARMVPSIL
ncbi:MAG: hypothetical protein HRF42_06015 [Candidatus Brocadia sp.]